MFLRLGSVWLLAFLCKFQNLLVHFHKFWKWNWIRISIWKELTTVLSFPIVNMVYSSIYLSVWKIFSVVFCSFLCKSLAHFLLFVRCLILFDVIINDILKHLWPVCREIQLILGGWGLKQIPVISSINLKSLIFI